MRTTAPRRCLLRPLLTLLAVGPATLVVTGFVPVRADAPPTTRPAVITTAPAAKTRAAFLKLIDRPVIDLAARAEPAVPDTTDPSLVVVAFAYDAEPGVRVPGVLVKRADAPAGRRHPAVVVMHGTSGSKKGELPKLRRLASRGFVAVAIDGRYHGERTKQPGTTEYTAAIAAAFGRADAEALSPVHPSADPFTGTASPAARRAFPFYYDTVWDARRLLDYLQTRDDVDPNWLGLMGISKGGIETYLTAAADERVAVAVPCIGVQSFAYGLATDGWRPRVGTVQAGFDAAARAAGLGGPGQDAPDAAFARRFYDRVVPGIYDRFDGPAMLAATAPRPLLVINGDSDDKTPLPGVHIAASAAEAAYAAAGAADRFRLLVQPNTGHTVAEPAVAEAVKWFERWLAP